MKIFIVVIFGLIVIVIGGLIIFFLLGAVLLLPLKYKYWRKLKLKSKKQLENEVYNFADDYFSFIGYGNTSVKKFRDLINKKELVGIKANWQKLSMDFRNLEKKMGHSGRPLLFDYYCWYEMTVNELHKRNT